MKFRPLHILPLLIAGLLLISTARAYDRARVDSYLNKRYLSAGDIQAVDSLLAEIKMRSGKNNADYVNLTAKRMNYTYGGGLDTIEYMTDDILLLAPLDIPYDYNLVKKVLMKCQSFYYGKDKVKNKEKIAKIESVRWNAEKIHFIDSLNLNLLFSYYNRYDIDNKYEKVDSILADYEDFVKIKFGDSSRNCHDALTRRIGRLQINMRNIPDERKSGFFKLLEQKFDERLNLEKKLYGNHSYRYQESLCNYANTMKVYMPASISHEDSLGYNTKIFDRLSEWYAIKGDTLSLVTLSNQNALSSLIRSLNDYNKKHEARNVAKKYIEKAKEAYGRNSEEYYRALLSHENQFLDENGDPDDNYLDEMIAVAENVYGKSDPRYQYVLQRKSLIAISRGDIGNALNILESECPDRSSGWSDRELATLYAQYGRTKEARKLYYRLIEKDIEDSTNSTNLLSDFIQLLGDCYSYRDLREMCNLVSDLIARCNFDRELQYRIFKIGCAYIGFLQQPESIDFINRVIASNPYMLQHPYLHRTLILLIEVNALAGNYDEAFEYAEKIRSIPDLKDGELFYLLLCEFISMAKKDYTETIGYNVRAREFADANTLEGRSLIYRNAVQCMKTGDYKTAYAIMNDLMDSSGKDTPPALLTGDNMEEVVSLFRYFIQQGVYLGDDVKSNFADICYNVGKTDEAYALILPILSGSLDNLAGVIDFYITKGMNRELQQRIDENTSLLSRWAVRYPDDALITSEAYNTLLLTKQLELNTLDNIRNIALSSGDQILADKYRELIRINKLQDEAIAAGNPDPELAKQSAALTKQIAIDARLKGEISKNLLLDWKELQAVIGEKDCVVEFAAYTDENDSKRYMALFFDKNSVLKAVPLFEEADLKVASVNYSDDSAYHMIWEPILDNLGTVENIYFSPSGNLHLVGIEYLSDGSSTMSDRYNMYRLSSTRELLNSEIGKINSAVLYGGVDYDAEVKPLLSGNHEETHESVEFRDMMSDLARGVKRGVAYLPGTRQEVEEINSLIGPHAQTVCLEGRNASEKSVKELSGKSPSLLHIATHGFFMTDKASKISGSMFGSLGSDALSRGDKSMIRSGILLAGANQTLTGKINVSDDDDGILTAKEVSILDLGNTDLVVLSACNSAVGEISGEGVYGIQRGFKMAGASSILVTLREVDDRATQLLMTNFYTNIVDGKSAREALMEAIGFLRNYKENGEKPYSDPKYWAPFVLVDGR